MTKYDLCTGDIVLSTKGSYGIVLIGTNGDDQIKWYSNNKGQVINRFRSFSMINEDLTFKYDLGNRIIKVWRTNIILVIKQLQNIMQQNVMDLNASMKS